MKFWGVEVKGGEPLQCYPGEEYLVHVSQACLGEKKKDKGNEPVYIYAKIDDKKFVIGTLSHDKFPQLVLDLVFEKEFELSHTGKNASVHFSGYKVLKQDETDDSELEDDSEEDAPVAADTGKPCTPPRNWLELPEELLLNILQKLGAVEILTRAQHVCPTWRRKCRDPSLWQSIDIRGEVQSQGKTNDLWKLCCQAVNRSAGKLLYVNLDFFAGDDVLRYITDRSSLKRFRLELCFNVSDKGLVEVAGRMPDLEELDLSDCQFSSETVAAVGRLCTNLNSFKLNARKCRHASDDEALAIAKSMPELQHLQIYGNSLTNAGLVAILDGCQRLESLDLRQCLNVEFSDADLMRRCSQRLKDFRHPYTSTTADYPFHRIVLDELSDADSLYLMNSLM